MKRRRILSVILVLTFLFATLPHVGAFSDTAGHPAEDRPPENRWNQERTKGPGLCPAKERETDI